MQGRNAGLYPPGKLKDLFDEEPGLTKGWMQLFIYKEGEDYTCYVSGSNVVTPGTFYCGSSS
jgi:hypothetical protein